VCVCVCVRMVHCALHNYKCVCVCVCVRMVHCALHNYKYVCVRAYGSLCKAQ